MRVGITAAVGAMFALSFVLPAEAASIGEKTADWFPKLSLMGDLSFSAADPGHLAVVPDSTASMPAVEVYTSATSAPFIKGYEDVGSSGGSTTTLSGNEGIARVRTSTTGSRDRAPGVRTSAG